MVYKINSNRSSYKKTNPLKELLKSKQQTVHVSGNKKGEPIKLFKAKW